MEVASQTQNDPEPAVRSRAGRKRDSCRDAVILDATLTLLAEQGYEGTTIELVATRAGMARTTVYRRWPTKTDLVLAAVHHLSSTDVGAADLPDTGSLRGDMVAMILPLDDDGQQVRIRAVTGLLTLASTDARLADAASSAGIGPWIAAGRTLIERAIDRGEYPPGDVATLATVIPMLCVSRAVQQLPITREFGLALIDGVVLPALRGGH